ncbi:MAG: hypothetical protein RI986_1054 [Planctomycetota bacterium]
MIRMRATLISTCCITLALAGCASTEQPTEPSVATDGAETSGEASVSGESGAASATAAPADELATAVERPATEPKQMTADMPTAVAQNPTDTRPTRDGQAHRWELRAFSGDRIEVFMDSQPVPPDHVVRKGNHVAVINDQGTVIERLDIPDTWTPEHGTKADAPGVYRTRDGATLTAPKAMLGGRLEAVPPATLAHLHAEHTTPSGAECAYVAQVIPGLALEQAGVMPHDVIVAINGSSNASPEAIREVVRAAAPGEHVKFVVVRAGQTRQADVTLIPWEAKHMLRAVGQVDAVAPASASSAPGPDSAAAAASAAATAAAATASANAASSAAAAKAAAAADPATQDELSRARARITDLERRMQADEAVRRSIRPQPMPAPTSGAAPAGSDVKPVPAAGATPATGAAPAAATPPSV